MGKISQGEGIGITKGSVINLNRAVITANT